MSEDYSYDNYRTCATCGNSYDTFSPRMAVGALDCRSCEMGFSTERQKNAGPPSAEYVARQRALWRAEGACVECGSLPNGDELKAGVCQACVLAMEKDQEQQRARERKAS